MHRAHRGWYPALRPDVPDGSVSGARSMRARVAYVAAESEKRDDPLARPSSLVFRLRPQWTRDTTKQVKKCNLLIVAHYG